MASPSDHAASLNAARADKSFFGHPRGLATLFFTEMWERFSYYGMRAILIFYLTASVAKGGLGFADSKAGAVYGLYTAMVYLMCLGGGWVADRIIGQRRAVLIGGILIACGEFCLVAPALTAVLPGAGAAGLRHRPAEGQRQHHRRAVVRAGRSAARFGLFHLLHGDQYRRVDFAADLRLGRRAHQLAPRLRRGRTGHARGARPIPAYQPASGLGGPASGLHR